MTRFLILLCLVLSSCSLNAKQDYSLLEVIDGDSIIIKSSADDKTEEVRLLGIDTPEYSQDPWGKRAREFVLSRVEPGAELKVELTKPKRDKYGRLLAYVFYQEEDGDWELLNEEILEHGYAELFVLQKFSAYSDDLKDAEAESREARLNIWSENGLKMSPYEYRKKYMKR